VQIYNSVKAGDPNALIGMGGLWKGSPNAFDSWQPYIKSMIARARGHFDFATGHFYDDPTKASVSTASWNIWTWWLKKYGAHVGQTAEDLFAAAGINVPIVNDESGPPHVTDQATINQGFVNQFKMATDGSVDTAVVYPAEPDVPGYPPLFNADGTPTPAVAALHDYLASVSP